MPHNWAPWNWMFLYAATLGIADTLNYVPIINPDHPLVELFDIKHISGVKLVNNKPLSEEEWKKKTDRSTQDLITRNLTLAGYFQSWKYFVNISEQVRSALTKKSAYLDEAKSFIAAINNHSTTQILIGIHVRRGDFLSPGSLESGNMVADIHYINRSMHFYRERFKHAHFVVCSDDMKWAKENIKGSDVTFSIFQTPIIDMAIMSLCDYMLITGGSFGWWGGWLSGGTVVYLEDFPRPGSHLAALLPRDSYYPPHWIGMTNGV